MSASLCAFCEPFAPLLLSICNRLPQPPFNLRCSALKEKAELQNTNSLYLLKTRHHMDIAHMLSDSHLISIRQVASGVWLEVGLWVLWVLCVW